jgi:hypothetical protein
LIVFELYALKIASTVLWGVFNLQTYWAETLKTYLPKPGHFSRSLSKGPNTTTWVWNLHSECHDFDSHTSDLEEISRKVFSAHFGQLGIIFAWLSGCDTLCFFNYFLKSVLAISFNSVRTLKRVGAIRCVFSTIF